MDYTESAIKKLEEEKEKKCDFGTNIERTIVEEIKGPTIDALESFVKQDIEFAQAVMQGEDMKAFWKNICQKIESNNGRASDLEVYKAAVNFFFPGAEVHYNMTIDLCGSVSKPPIECSTAESTAEKVEMVEQVQEQKQEESSITVSFDDLF